MYAARLVIVVLLILAVIVAYNPQTREQAVKTWEKLRPAVVGATDSLYVSIRDLITGHPAKDGKDEMPVPGPGGNFERIVTMNASSVL